MAYNTNMRRVSEEERQRFNGEITNELRKKSGIIDTGVTHLLPKVEAMCIGFNADIAADNAEPGQEGAAFANTILSGLDKINTEYGDDPRIDAVSDARGILSRCFGIRVKLD